MRERDDIIVAEHVDNRGEVAVEAVDVDPPPVRECLQMCLEHGADQGLQIIRFGT